MANDTLSLKKSESTSTTVSVASKLPMPLVLKIYDFATKYEPVMGGGTREYKIAVDRRGAKQYVIDGNSVAQNKAPHQQLVAGFAITHGIPRAFWEEWLEQNKEAEYVANGMIFAHAETASTIAQAKDNETIKSGLERMNPADIHKHGLQAATTA